MTNEERLAKIQELNAAQSQAEAEQIKELNERIASADIKQLARTLIAESRPTEASSRAASNLLSAINNIESVVALHTEVLVVDESEPPST